jgi:hypothetical protein
MDTRTILMELLFAGFFAVAVVRAHEPATPGGPSSLADFFRLSGRWERLRRSRWQWFALVAFMLVLRLQQQLPLVLEAMVVLQFAVFMAMPSQAKGHLRKARD